MQTVPGSQGTRRPRVKSTQRVYSWARRKFARDDDTNTSRLFRQLRAGRWQHRHVTLFHPICESMVVTTDASIDQVLRALLGNELL